MCGIGEIIRGVLGEGLSHSKIRQSPPCAFGIIPVNCLSYMLKLFDIACSTIRPRPNLHLNCATKQLK